MRTLCALLLGLALSAPYAFAQTPTTEPTSTASAQLKILTQEAGEAFTAKTYQQALERYRALYALEPEPVFLYMIAECYRNLEQIELAIAFYQLFVEKTPKSYPQHEIATQLIERMTANKNYEATRRQKAYKNRLVLSALSGAAGLSFGGISLLNVKKLNDRTEFASFSELEAAGLEALNAKKQRAALLSDALLGVALLTGGSALLIHRTKTKKADTPARAALSLAPNGATFSLRY